MVDNGTFLQKDPLRFSSNKTQNMVECYKKQFGIYLWSFDNIFWGECFDAFCQIYGVLDSILFRFFIFFLLDNDLGV